VLTRDDSKGKLGILHKPHSNKMKTDDLGAPVEEDLRGGRNALKFPHNSGFGSHSQVREKDMHRMPQGALDPRQLNGTNPYLNTLKLLYRNMQIQDMH
jgi:hypothetical protein